MFGARYRNWGARDFDSQIRSATHWTGWWEKTGVETEVERAKRTRGGSSWWPREPLHDHYLNNLHVYGEYIAHTQGAFSDSLCARLSELEGAAHGSTPFLLVRNLYPVLLRPWKYPGEFVAGHDLVDGHYDEKVFSWTAPFIRDLTYDIISTALIFQLQAVHRRKDPTDDHVYRNYISSPFSAVDQFTNDADLPLRFRTAVPEYRFKDDPVARANTLTARFALYVCVENPMQDPIWVLDAERVAEFLTPDERAELEKDRYVMFDNWLPGLRGRLRDEVQRIKEPERATATRVARLSFDANRIQVDAAETHVESRATVAALREALQDAGAIHAVPVPLRRGDVLIVDNYRAFIRRAQNTRPAWNLLGKPARRWLRMYCGFPQWKGSTQTRAEGSSEQDWAA